MDDSAATRVPQVRFASYECQRCGACIGWIGRALQCVGLSQHRCAYETDEDGFDASWAPSVAVGFPVDRTDGLIALHLGRSYTYLTEREAHELNKRLCQAIVALTAPRT